MGKLKLNIENEFSAFNFFVKAASGIPAASVQDQLTSAAMGGQCQTSYISVRTTGK